MNPLLELEGLTKRFGCVTAVDACSFSVPYGSVTALARTLFRDHALSFELTSILLLVAVVGAVVLAKRGAE